MDCAACEDRGVLDSPMGLPGHGEGAPCRFCAAGRREARHRLCQMVILSFLVGMWGAGIIGLAHLGRYLDSL